MTKIRWKIKQSSVDYREIVEDQVRQGLQPANSFSYKPEDVIRMGNFFAANAVKLIRSFLSNRIKGGMNDGGL
jgi:hypothetical protein